MTQKLKTRLNTGIIIALLIVVSHAIKGNSYDNCMSYALSKQAEQISKELGIKYNKSCQKLSYYDQHIVRELRQEQFKLAQVLLEKSRRNGVVANWKKRVLINDLNSLYSSHSFLQFTLKN